MDENIDLWTEERGKDVWMGGMAGMDHGLTQINQLI